MYESDERHSSKRLPVICTVLDLRTFSIVGLRDVNGAAFF